MKKSLKISILTLSTILLLTGCGSKNSKLVCTQTASGVDIAFNVNFEGNLVTSMDMAYEMDLSSYNDLQINALKEQNFCELVKSSVGEFKDGFENCQQTVDNKKLKVTSDLNVNKFSDNVLDTMGSPKATKQELEKQGYSCTIE